jgi:hypothetical protein
VSKNQILVQLMKHVCVCVDHTIQKVYVDITQQKPSHVDLTCVLRQKDKNAYLEEEQEKQALYGIQPMIIRHERFPFDFCGVSVESEVLCEKAH